MNDLQRTEFEILKAFVEICEKLGLTYYLVCGSALGAVKYQGFIPWDDDIDVALPREDYETFLQHAPHLLDEHLFLQNYRTEPEFPKVFTKLRDVRTEYVEKGYQELNICHGVFIDVFPLDGYPSEEKEMRRFERKRKAYQRLTSCALDSEGPLRSKILRSFLRILGCHRHTAEYLKAYEALLRSYRASDVYCNYGNVRGKLEKMPREVYGAGHVAVFEGMYVHIPLKYTEYLTEKYGEYMSDPPVSEQVGHHDHVAMDLEHPYQNRLNRYSKPLRRGSKDRR